MEEYKTVNIKKYDNYEVSNFGNIRNKLTGRILKKHLSPLGYYIVSLSNKQKTTYLVHILVAKTFLENTENKERIDHINGDKTNNNINNLRFATASENSQNQKIRKNNTSTVKGVYFHKKSNKYMAYICQNKKVKYIGIYEKLEDAKKARQTKAQELYQEYIHKSDLQ